MCRIYSSDKHALCFLPLRCLLFSEERSDLFIFMGCSLAKNITAMKGSFNRSWDCWFGTGTLPWLNSVVSHNSFLTRSSFAATDSECTGSGQIFWLGFGTWWVTRPVALFAVCAAHIAPPPAMKLKLGPLWFVSSNSRSWAAISKLAQAVLSFPQLEVVLCYISLNKSIHCGALKNRALP